MVGKDQEGSDVGVGDAGFYMVHVQTERGGEICVAGPVGTGVSGAEGGFDEVVDGGASEGVAVRKKRRVGVVGIVVVVC